MIFKCRNCGGNVVYDPERGRMHCPYCDGVDTQEQEEGDGQPVCKNCGEPLKQTPGARRKVFCDNHCRYEWWNRTRAKKPYLLTCYHCGKQFTSYGNRKRKFCGRECYLLSRYGEGLP